MSRETAIDRDYVYMGRRVLQSGKLGHEVAEINEDGSLGKPRVYGVKMSKVIGGVYRGAAFDEKNSYGLIGALYDHKWENQDDLIAWEALDNASRIDMARVRTEKDAKLNAQMHACLLPIRRAIHAANKRGDWQGAAAIRHVFTALLAKPMTKEEAGE